jgi:uncharacterized membrane protein
MKKKSTVRVGWLGSVLAVTTFAGACGEDLPDVSCDGTVPAYADVTAFEKCSTCHSSELSGSERRGALASVNFDTESAAQAKAEDAAAEVKEGAMPPKSSGIKLTDQEKQDLYKWALCQSPSD